MNWKILLFNFRCEGTVNGWKVKNSINCLQGSCSQGSMHCECSNFARYNFLLATIQCILSCTIKTKEKNNFILKAKFIFDHLFYFLSHLLCFFIVFVFVCIKKLILNSEQTVLNHILLHTVYLPIVLVNFPMLVSL